MTLVTTKDVTLDWSNKRTNLRNHERRSISSEITLGTLETRNECKNPVGEL